MRRRTQPEKKTDAGADATTLGKGGGWRSRREAERQGRSALPKTAEEEQPFFDYLASLGNRWSAGGLKLHIYRLWPELDLGEKHYIGIVREPIDEEYLAVHHGSGKYMLLLKSPLGKPRTHNVSIHDPQRPPRVDEALVVNNPVNDRYFKVWGAKRNGNADKPPMDTKSIGHTRHYPGRYQPQHLLELLPECNLNA